MLDLASLATERADVIRSHCATARLLDIKKAHLDDSQAGFVFVNVLRATNLLVDTIYCGRRLAFFFLLFLRAKCLARFSGSFFFADMETGTVECFDYS